MIIMSNVEAERFSAALLDGDGDPVPLLICHLVL